MLLGGLQKLTLIDYPDHLAATVFSVGCNFCCPFCHNPELVDPQKIKKQPKLLEKDFFDFLAARQGLLEGVCVYRGRTNAAGRFAGIYRPDKKIGLFGKTRHQRFQSSDARKFTE